MVVPLRHVRPRVGSAWLMEISTNAGDADEQLIAYQMDQVECRVLAHVYTYRRQWRQQSPQCIKMPEGLEERPLVIATNAK